MNPATVIEAVRRLEELAGIREASDPTGEVKRVWLREQLDSLSLSGLSCNTLTAVVAGLNRKSYCSPKAKLVDIIRRVVLERIEVLHSADS